MANVQLLKQVFFCEGNFTFQFILFIIGWSFEMDEQVFEQYGQPNHIYFMYHGFILPVNSFDCVHIEMMITEEESSKIDWKLHRVLLQV